MDKGVLISPYTLTLNTQNCSKDYKRSIYIPYHILDLVQQKKTKYSMEQPYMLPFLYCQYHACRCPGDLRSQRISRRGIDQISQNILALASEELTMTFICWSLSFFVDKNQYMYITPYIIWCLSDKNKTCISHL